MNLYFQELKERLKGAVIKNKLIAKESVEGDIMHLV